MTATSLPALYTPETMRRIRAGATARDLGWDAERYRGVCRKHGIASSVAGDSTSATASRHEQPETITGGIAFDPLMRTVTRNDIMVELPSVHARVFSALFDHHRSGDQGFLSAETIHVRMKSQADASAVGIAIGRMQPRLKIIGLWVESRSGSSGGFRLRTDGAIAR